MDDSFELKVYVCVYIYTYIYIHNYHLKVILRKLLPPILLMQMYIAVHHKLNQQW